MRLESGPAAYDRNYYLAFLVLCVGLGGYFCYDYIVGYPGKNREAAKKQLAPLFGPDFDTSTLAESPTKPVFDALLKTQPTDLTKVHEKLGKPFDRREAGEGRAIEYFISAYGMATVPIVRGQVNPKGMQWTKWYKTKEDIKLQLYCAIITFAVGLYVLRRVYKAATLRAVIDEESMIYGGQRIPLESMTRLCDYSRKGWVDLYYQHGREERRLRIDNQKIRKFDEIIDVLCEAKGFEDPRKADEEAKDAEMQPDATAESAEPIGPSEDDASDTGGAK